MKSKLAVLIIVCFLFQSISFGEIVSFEGGLVGDTTMTKGEYNYQEILFITGKPILVTGTVKIPEIPVNRDTYPLSYVFKLRNIEADVTVSRKVTFEVTKEVKDAYSMTTYKYDLPKSNLDETITVAGDTYNLDSFEYTRSMIYDNTAAVDYFSGHQYVTRTYYKNGNPLEYDEKIVVEITSDHDEGAMIGYRHLWGDAETYMTKMTIKGESLNPDYDESNPKSKQMKTWWGSVDLKASEQTFSNFKYQKTAPQNISFFGSYVKVDEIENVFQYTYDLPLIEGGLKDLVKRNKGESNLRNDKIVDGSSMIIPKLRDIGGHWSEANIFLLSSLEILNNDSEFYSPDQPLTRIEFAEMISNAIATIEERSQTDIIRSLRPGARTMFHDIPNDYPKYNYVTFVYNAGIMSGDANYFFPEDQITRAQVITILVNALGLENRAPALPFETRYLDDQHIPNWSKRFIYMADEIGLVKGFPDNTIRPNARVTRAEGAAMIVNLIDHMKDNIRIDYREKIINRY